MPRLNPEISLKLSNHLKTRDNHMSTRQQLASSALAALGSTMSSLIEETESIDKVIFMERLMDAAKCLTEIMHSTVKSRIASILAGVDRNIKATLEKTESGEFLFGNNLSEKL